jgi:catechol 2,3-dioxygenase-like lactoylglutathione lyase family enzyme
VFNGAHVIIYSRTAEADRDFLRDHLGFPNVDAGDGWLIFKLPPAEIAFHPTEGDARTELSLMTDDVAAAVESLTAAGAKVITPPTDRRWGILAEVALPSGTPLSLYEPRHPIAHDLA